MTLTRREHDILVSKLERNALPLIDETFRMAVSGRVIYGKDEWEAALDWIGGPLMKRLLYGDQIPPNERGEKSQLYKYFETFHRAKTTGELENPTVVALVFAIMKAFEETGAKAKHFFKVEYREVVEEEPPALTDGA